ncbi:MAG TPA: TetR family transcriptional regulator [Mycobacteriales bacterium]|jgi:AcrR family transcriptional regulator|nr:TetR family transcriptional regulator [Mycobacteriales bacterium]
MPADVSTRDALLDAAYDVVVAGNWQRARMVDVAATAGVSRQTLYNEFGSKDALAQALAERESQRFIEGTNRFIDEVHPDRPVDAIAAATEWTIREASDNPLLKAVLTDDTHDLLPFLTTRGEVVIGAARRNIESYWLSHWPDLPAEDVELVSEMVARLTISYLVLPSDGPDGSAEAIAARMAQLVERLLMKGAS